MSFKKRQPQSNTNMHRRRAALSAAPRVTPRVPQTSLAGVPSASRRTEFGDMVWKALLLLVANVLMSMTLAWGGGSIGVDYGLNGDNLLPPKQTVALLRAKRVTRVRLYEARQDVLEAFANSGIDVLLGIANKDVPKIAASLLEAIRWVNDNVVAHPASGISTIVVGNEWLLDSTLDSALLLPAMLNIYTALINASPLPALDLQIKVTTSHAFNILGKSFPPSAAVFRGGLLSILKPILEFLERTGSYFVINVFPYFAYIDDPNVSLDFALFNPSAKPVRDPNTNLIYTNLFDLQLDAVYAAIGSLLGLSSVESFEASVRKARPRHRVVVGESGWPSGPGGSGSVPSSSSSRQLTIPTAFNSNYRSKIGGNTTTTITTTTTSTMITSTNAHRHHRTPKPKVTPSAPSSGTCTGRECTAASVKNARTYNQNLINHVHRSSGTPANLNSPIDAYIFEVYNEDLKPPGIEQHFGLFNPNGTPVYPITF